MRVACKVSVVASIPFGVTACFDSDERPLMQATTTTGTPELPMTTTDPGTSTGLPATTGVPDISCRDAVVCIQNCSFRLITDPGIEPDLGCFLECEEQLTVMEAYHLLRLANCAAEECEALESCMSSETGGADENSSDLIDPCLVCVFTLMSDQQPDVCQEFHELCNEDDV